MATFSSGQTQVADPLSKSFSQETRYKRPSVQVQLFFFFNLKVFHFCVPKYRAVRSRHEGISGHSGKIMEHLTQHDSPATQFQPVLTSLLPVGFSSLGGFFPPTSPIQTAPPF